MTLEERARKVVADVLGLPPGEVTAATSHENVADWDSVNIINLMMALEAEFSVELGVDDAARLISVASIVEVLGERGAS